MVNRKQKNICKDKQHKEKRLLSQKKGTGRLSYQSHSRKATGSYLGFQLKKLINYKYIKSSAQLMKAHALSEINQLIHKSSSPFSIKYYDCISISSPKETFQNLFLFSKNLQANYNQPCIQHALVNIIKNRKTQQFQSKPLIHFQYHILPSMSIHLQKLRKYFRKSIRIAAIPSNKLQSELNNRFPAKVLVDQYQNDISSEQRKLNISESFELRNLANCIKDVFNKQRIYNNKGLQLNQTQSSWLIQNNEQSQMIIDCDYSVIKPKSTSFTKKDYQRQIEDYGHYGLGYLKKKNEDNQVLLFNEVNPSKQPVIHKKGHRRNQTQSITAKSNHFNTLTPRVNTLSSSIQLQSQKQPQKQTVNGRKKSTQGPYQLHFNKPKVLKKQNRPQCIKQNETLVKSKGKGDMNSLLKSRSKQKSSSYLKKGLKKHL